MPAEAQTKPAVNALNVAVEYANDVLTGRIVACDLVKRAVKRFLEDLECSAIETAAGTYPPIKQIPGRPALIFKEAEADKVVAFFHGFLKHTKGEWDNEFGKQAFKLEPWQIFILANIFGWYKKVTDTRRFTEVYVEVARKNGKTTLLQGIGLYALLMDGEPGASVCCAATKEPQAREVFDGSVSMVRDADFLSTKVRIEGKIKVNRLFVESTRSKFEPVAAEDKKLDGRNDTCVIVDELHAQCSGALYQVLQKGTTSRRQPLTIAITTAGFDKSETNFCYQKRTRIVNILKGVVSNATDGWGSDNVFGFIACLDEGDNAFDERNWPKANPSLAAGVVNIYRLREYAADAKQLPDALNDFLTKNMNVWTSQKTAAIDPDKWKACCAAGPNSDKRQLRDEAEQKLKGRRCFGGIDLSENIDLTSFYLVFPPIPDDPKWYALGWNWVPEDTIPERVRKDHVHYDAWHKQGFLKATNGKVVDLDFIEKWVLLQREKFQIAEIGFDPYRAIEFSSHLTTLGVPLVKIQQTTTQFHEPLQKLFALIITKGIEHFGDPVLAWAAGNLTTFKDTNGNMKPDKNAAREKIDPMVALLMGMNRALATALPAENPYAKRGIVFI